MGIEIRKKLEICSQCFKLNAFKPGIIEQDIDGSEIFLNVICEQSKRLRCPRVKPDISPLPPSRVR